MNVAAGTWRQGGRIGGTKEAGTTFDPHLAVEQRHAIVRQRAEDTRQINTGILAPEHEAALIFDMLRDQRMSGVLGGNPGLFLGERLIDVLPNGAAVYEADDLFRGRTGESTQDMLDRIDRGDIHETDVALAALGAGVAVETLLASPILAVGAVSGLIPLARDYLVSRGKGISIAEAEELSLTETSLRLVKIVNGITALAVAASGLGVGGGVVKKLAEGDHQSPDWKPPVKALELLAAASAFLATCREWLAGQTPQPLTVEVTIYPTPSAMLEPTGTRIPQTETLIPTVWPIATETPTLVPTETPMLPLPAFISGETIGDGTVLFPIMRAPLPSELSTFIPVDGKLDSGGGELTGLSGVKLCLGVESDATCYGVRAPAPEFLSRHLDDRVVTYRLDRNVSKDGVQVYTTNETGEGIAPQQVFINRVPMRPGLHFETVIRDGSDQNNPGAGQLLMTWIDGDGQVVESLAQVRDFNQETDRIDVDYQHGRITIAYGDGRVEPFDIGAPVIPFPLEPEFTVQDVEELSGRLPCFEDCFYVSYFSFTKGSTMGMTAVSSGKFRDLDVFDGARFAGRITVSLGVTRNEHGEPIPVYIVAQGSSAEQPDVNLLATLLGGLKAELGIDLSYTPVPDILRHDQLQLYFPRGRVFDYMVRYGMRDAGPHSTNPYDYLLLFRTLMQDQAYRTNVSRFVESAGEDFSAVPLFTEATTLVTP